jgi:hypothetical protein
MTRVWLKMTGLVESVFSFVLCDGGGEGIHVSRILVICVSDGEVCSV